MRHEPQDPVPPVILASASPRRADILRMVGLTPDRIEPARVEEKRKPGEDPRLYVERLACEKARAVAARDAEGLVLAGDTIVILEGRILEKPGSPQEAAAMLRRLSGRRHTVLTGMAAARRGRVWSLVAEAAVGFRTLGDAEIEEYVATGEPLDKAGGYGIQGYGSALVASVDGDYYAVVGFSVVGLEQLLRRTGFRMGLPGLVRLRDVPQST